MTIFLPHIVVVVLKYNLFFRKILLISESDNKVTSEKYIKNEFLGNKEDMLIWPFMITRIFTFVSKIFWYIKPSSSIVKLSRLIIVTITTSSSQLNTKLGQDEGICGNFTR